jgi:hypothetical protein
MLRLQVERAQAQESRAQDKLAQLQDLESEQLHEVGLLQCRNGC